MASVNWKAVNVPSKFYLSFSHGRVYFNSSLVCAISASSCRYVDLYICDKYLGFDLSVGKSEFSLPLHVEGKNCYSLFAKSILSSFLPDRLLSSVTVVKVPVEIDVTDDGMRVIYLDRSTLNV